MFLFFCHKELKAERKKFQNNVVILICKYKYLRIKKNSVSKHLKFQKGSLDGWLDIQVVWIRLRLAGFMMRLYLVFQTINKLVKVNMVI